MANEEKSKLEGYLDRLSEKFDQAHFTEHDLQTKLRLAERIKPSQSVKEVLETTQSVFFKYGVQQGPQGKAFYAQSLKLDEDSFPDKASMDAMQSQLDSNKLHAYDLDIDYFEKITLLEWQFHDDNTLGHWASTDNKDGGLTSRINFSFVPDNDFFDMLFEEIDLRQKQNNPDISPA